MLTLPLPLALPAPLLLPPRLPLPPPPFHIPPPSPPPLRSLPPRLPPTGAAAIAHSVAVAAACAAAAAAVAAMAAAGSEILNVSVCYTPQEPATQTHGRREAKRDGRQCDSDERACRTDDQMDEGGTRIRAGAGDSEIPGGHLHQGPEISLRSFRVPGIHEISRTFHFLRGPETWNFIPFQ